MGHKTDYTDVSDVAISDEKRDRLYEAAERSRNRTQPPDGWQMEYL